MLFLNVTGEGDVPLLITAGCRSINPLFLNLVDSTPRPP